MAGLFDLKVCQSTVLLTSLIFFWICLFSWLTLEQSNVIWLAAEIWMSGMHSTWLNCAVPCIGMHPMPSVMWYSSNLLEFVSLVLQGDSHLPASYLQWVPLLTQTWEEKSVCSFKCFWGENASFVGREIPIVGKLRMDHGTLYNKFISKNWSKMLWHTFVVYYISTNSKFLIESCALETVEAS